MSTVVDNFKRNYGSSNVVSRLKNVLVKRAKWLAVAGVVPAIAFYGWESDWFAMSSKASTSSLLMHEVALRDLPITVIERGNLESQTNVQVFCEVDDYRSDGVSGTTILWMIPNGSSVSKGDLICELDSSAIQTELDEQILDTEEAKSEFVQAQANLENQSIENQTSIEKADLDVQLAELELEMFQDPSTGSHQLAIEAIQRQIDDLNNEILAAEMNLKLRRNETTGIESLFKLGYAGKSELDRSVLSLLQAEGDYAAKLNKLNTQMASLEKLDNFEKEMQKLQLEGNKRTCIQNLKQTRITNEAKLSQMQGILTARTEQLTKEEERLKRYQSQFEKCKIYAPQDGMVAYAPPSSSRDPEIAEGASVRLRQLIFSIPNLRAMQVETSIHESALDRIQPGLTVSVTVDAFSDRSYKGTVKSVAVLPERSYYSDTQKYKTVITIDEEVYQLKPGMTAVCEVNVDYLPSVKAVPLQAVVQRSGTNWLYVRDNDKVVRRKVSLGTSNDQFVAVNDGIDVGELVVLNPGSLIDEAEEAAPLEDGTAEEVPSAETFVATTEEPSAIN